MTTWKLANGDTVVVEQQDAFVALALGVGVEFGIRSMRLRLTPAMALEVVEQLTACSYQASLLLADKVDHALAAQGVLVDAGDDGLPDGYTIDSADGEPEMLFARTGCYWRRGPGVIQAEPPCARAQAIRLAQLDHKHREQIEKMIEVFEDRDRIELLIEHGGGLVPATLRHQDWEVPGELAGSLSTWMEDVALCLDVEVPALRGSGDPDPVAIGEDAIVAWADQQQAVKGGPFIYADLESWRAGEAVPLRMAVKLLAAEPLPEQ